LRILSHAAGSGRGEPPRCLARATPGKPVTAAESNRTFRPRARPARERTRPNPPSRPPKSRHTASKPSWARVEAKNQA